MLHQLTEITISNSRLDTEIYCHHVCARIIRFMQEHSLLFSVLVSKIKYIVPGLERWKLPFPPAQLQYQFRIQMKNDGIY